MKNTNYFGRVCRFLGRISLFAGFILSIGIGALLVINPFISIDGSRNIFKIISSATYPQNPTSTAPRGVVLFFAQNEILSWIVSATIIAAMLLALYYLCRKYNDVIRSVIANISKHTKMPIHMTELGLTLIIWSIVILMLIFSFPLAASFLIFSFIFNELFFLFGWISYGMPDYKI